MKIIAVISAVFTAIFMIFHYLNPLELFLTMAITMGTIAYHFWMRLLVGGVYNLIFKNKVDYSQKWFRVGKVEQRVYKVLKVKRWKIFFPTYDPAAFDVKQHSWSEIAGAMCQSELVHETNVALSFLPILSIRWFGAAAVFILTSVFAALFDLTFVLIQRFNRPRVLRMIKK